MGDCMHLWVGREKENRDDPPSNAPTVWRCQKCRLEFLPVHEVWQYRAAAESVRRGLADMEAGVRREGNEDG